MRRLALALVASAALTQLASAADLPAKAYTKAPVMVAAYSWTGWYVGLNAGGAWGRSNTDSPLGLPCTICYIPSVVVDINAQSSQRVNSSGFTGGLQLGYNVQANNIVFGVEADINAFSLRGTTTTSAAFTGFPVPAGGTPPTYTNDIRTNWLFTARGRLGFLVSNNLLLYGTGGVAATNLKYTHTYVEGVFPGSSLGSETSTASGTKWGGVIGAGLEYALGNQWSVKAEYLYLNFGSVNSTAQVVFGGVANGNTFTHSGNLNASVARLGLNMKL
jgi:outer membrane immunogenic protein